MTERSDRCRGSLAAAFGIALLVVTATQSTSAQTLTAGDPGANVNIIGPTPDPADIRDEGLKQQNEPACTIRPGDTDCIICAYNDYRTVDVEAIGDAWQGVSMSCDAGTTWTSRVAPGHAVHPAPIGVGFAADPRISAMPGMAIFNFIGGNRDEDFGVLAIQHWLEVNREDADFYEPGLNTIIADVGTSGRFIDKPDMVLLMDKSGQQGTITLDTVMENPALGTISRDFPTGDLFVAYAVFTGNAENSVKVLVKKSGDWGQTWSNQATKLSEDQNLVSGISLTAMGDSILAVWRRAGDNNDFDSIMYSYTTNRGKKWTKAEVLADICSFDQISASTPSAVTFRTNDFPWTANDGKNFYAFYSDRNYDGASDCTLGRPRIVTKYASSLQNLDTSPLVAIDDSDDGNPMTIEDAGGSFQFMPAAFGANGKVQVAWYDTRREGIPGGPPLVADYFDPMQSANVNRRVDVYSARITSDADGNNVQISPPVRVSQFRIGARVEETGSGQTAGSIAIEGEASFANAKLYASGTLSFIGDYIAVGAQEFRVDDNGKTVSNSSPIVDPHTDIADFFIAWASNRDVRGNIFDPTTLENTVPYAPSQNGGGMGRLKPVPKDPEEEHPPTLADDSEHDAATLRAEGIEDPFDPMPDLCFAGDPQDRTRNANVYGSRVRDQIRLFAPTITKPLTNLQRAFPVALSNANDVPRSFRLRITNQPDDAPVLGRSSFRQLPSVPPFDGPDIPAPVITEDLTVPPRSTLARTVFLVSNLSDATTGVETFDKDCVDANPSTYYVGACPVLASITLGGDGTTGPLQQPNFASPACVGEDPECTIDVLQAELHNPELINPELINPELINPELINPELINPELINPELINPELINPELINLGFANPELINPELINPELINPELINPELINPELINPELINSSLDDGVTWTDYTFAIRNTGNVTTALDADVTLAGPAAGDVDSQLIAWTLYITPTSRDCEFLPQVERRVLATVNNPDDSLDVASIDNPFAGGISALAVPGQIIFFTRRVFGTTEELNNIAVSGFTSASQAANCSQTDRPPGNTDPYFCQLTLAEERELILLDTQPPVFGGGLMDGDVIPAPPIEADRAGGACVDLPGSGLVTAEDNGIPVSVVCTDSLGASICTTSEPGQSIPVVTLANPSPAPVNCSAVDEFGNVASVDIFVEVLDTAAPEFTSFPTSPVNIDASPIDGTAAPDFEAGVAVADPAGVDPSPVLTCMASTGQMNGDPLPAGSNTIDCSVTDAAGNLAERSYVLQVNDVTPPVITLLGADPQTIEVGSPYIELGADVDDNVGVPGGLVIDSSGVMAAIPGSYDVIYTAADGAGNITTLSRTVIVTDSIAPEFVDIPLPDVSVEAAGTSGAVVSFTLPDASDVGDADVTVSCVPPSGSTFAVGDTTVTCTATDDSGNSASASFIVTVADTTAPSISVPSSGIDADLQSAAGANVDYAAQVAVVDDVDPSPTLDCSPASGSLFAPGTTSVSCTATDDAGNSASASFDVRVGYGGGFGITPAKLNVKAGSSNPLVWGWQDSAGNGVDSSGDAQLLEIRECTSGTVVLSMAGDPGSSGFRYKSGDSWQFNWQSDDGAGSPLPKGQYCAFVTSSITGQQLSSPPIRVR